MGFCIIFWLEEPALALHLGLLPLGLSEVVVAREAKHLVELVLRDVLLQVCGIDAKRQLVRLECAGRVLGQDKLVHAVLDRHGIKAQLLERSLQILALERRLLFVSDAEEFHLVLRKHFLTRCVLLLLLAYPFGPSAKQALEQDRLGAFVDEQRRGLGQAAQVLLAKVGVVDGCFESEPELLDVFGREAADPHKQVKEPIGDINRFRREVVLAKVFNLVGLFSFIFS